MAFDNKGAYWLSNVSEIKNPYFGEKMLTCGSVQDSLYYGKN
jgi:Cu(I)/Ag(I) efflux system membrane fusion protein